MVRGGVELRVVESWQCAGRRFAITDGSRQRIFPVEPLMAIIAMKEGHEMRSVNVAELKNRLSKYLTFAKGGEEVVIRDRNLPVAKLVPFIGGDASEQDLLLVAAGKMRLPQIRLDVKKLSKIPTGSVRGNKAIQAVISDREEDQ